MKIKLGYLLLCVLCLVGCDDFNKESDSFHYKIINIEGCEYIAFHTYGATSITHKGDCTNKVHFASALKTKTKK